jgi:hypothetical protein
MSVNVNTTTNSVVIHEENKTITVVDNRSNTSVVVTQPVSSVIEVVTAGPKGDKGAPGSDADISMLVTTASFNAFTSSYNTGSFTGSFTGFLYGTVSNSTTSETASYYNETDPIFTAKSASFTTTSSFNAFTSSYNSGSFSGSFSGSIYGTASYSTNSETSSYSISSSYYSETDPIFVAKSGSFATTGSNSFYGLQAISSSTDSVLDLHMKDDGLWALRIYNDAYSTSSIGLASWIDNNGISFLGTEIDKPLYIYTNASYYNPTLIISSSGVSIVSNLTVDSGITGSLYGTASWAVNSNSASFAVSSSKTESSSFATTAISATTAVTASSILGGKATHIPYFITDTTLATSSLYQSSSSTVIINQDNATTENPEALYVWQPSTTSFNVISGKGNLNNYLQLNIQNTNNGVSGSSDVVATANNGNESSNYIDMGINNENYNQNFIGNANDAYVYSTGNHLHIGNVSNYPVQIFAGSSDTDASRKLQIDPGNNHQLTGSLDSTGRIKAPSFTGSLQGSASYAESSTTSSYSTTLGASLSQPANNQVRLLSSQGSTLSTATINNVVSASHADQASTADYAATAGNGGVTQLIAGAGITLLPANGQGAVTVVSSGGGGVTIISGSLVTGSFINATSYTFDHNLATRTPIITVFDSNYNQIIPENIQLVNTSSAVITFPTPESGFAIGSTGGTTGTALSSSYAQFATYANTASYYIETDPIFVAKSGSFATTGSNVFRGNQTVTGSLFTSGSNTLVGSTTLTGSLSISGSQTFNGVSAFYGNHTLSGSNTITGNTIMSGSIVVSGSSDFKNSTFIVTGSAFFKGTHQVSGSTAITGSFSVKDGDINVVSGSSFTRWGNKLFNYGQFSDTTTQSGSANTAYAMKFNTTDFALNTRIVSESRITVDNTGIYNIQFSAQLGNTANTTVDFDIWFAYTGSNIANSNTQVTLNKVPGSVGRLVAAWNVATPIQANDYIEIYWSCTGATGQIQSSPAATGPTRPAIPSTIATLTQIA